MVPVRFRDLLFAAIALASGAARAADPGNPAEIRTRRVEAGPVALAARAVPEVGAEVVYAFFPDVAYTVTVARVEQVAAGIQAVKSDVEDGRNITCLAIVTAEGTRLTVRDYSRRRLYQRVSLPDGGIEYREYDLSKELPRVSAPSPVPPRKAGRTKEAALPFDSGGGGDSGVSPLATTYLDVMIVFDTTAQTWVADNGGVAAFAADAIARMNVAMQTSGIDCTFRLAATVLKSYSGGSELLFPLYDITNNSGVFSDIETLRTTYGADLVTLMIDTGSAYGSVGIGWVLMSTSGDPRYAYTACAIRSVNQSHTLTHEVGHNLGCGHAVNQADDPGPALFSYSSGYYFTASGNAYHTIMAYNRDGYGGAYDECDHFSTPLKTYGSSGVVVGNASTADNARTIRETMTAASTYREATVTTPPAAPTGVNASDGASTANVGVSWTASSGASSYSVWRGTSSSSGAATSIASGLTATSYNDTSATPGVLYYYWIKATNGAGTSGFSASNTGYRKLAAPTGVSATDGTSTTQVTLNWSAVTGASYYRVYRATSSSGTKTALGSWQTGLSYSDTSAVAGTTYYYFVVAAVDASGTRPSDYSSYDTGYRGVTTIPAAPTGVNAADGASTANVGVSWTASSGATSYSVWRGTSSSSGAATSIASGLTATSYNDTSATPGVLYYY
ncbi:MAG: M12 family metallo-peptidase, partial [Kiritimatiellae bacterium]|nr:M12 family metallo-peptidase [Kiritimatiellia bacterium]